ncbi:MAG: hypothetical protein COA79_20880 [Planctomycetota bacterium]|nr:MAG: hypothetical protein COA79_20880 [Planctomycetota bacterium]
MKVLIVNEDEKITDLLNQYLLKFYDVTIFSCPIKALVHYATYCEYDIVFSDYQSAKLAMNEFIDQVLLINPKQKFILNSASMNNRLFDLANKYEDNIYMCDLPAEKEIFKALCGSIVDSNK